MLTDHDTEQPSRWKHIGPARRVPALANCTESIGLMKRWLEDCQTRHPACQPARTATLPTRVIHVGESSENVSLYLSKPGEAGTYTALSHCWGGQTPLATTQATLQERQKSIHFDGKSRTFAEAVEVTRALGFKYLWYVLVSPSHMHIPKAKQGRLHLHHPRQHRRLDRRSSKDEPSLLQRRPHPLSRRRRRHIPRPLWRLRRQVIRPKHPSHHHLRPVRFSPPSLRSSPLLPPLGSNHSASLQPTHHAKQALHPRLGAPRAHPLPTHGALLQRGTDLVVFRPGTLRVPVYGRHIPLRHLPTATIPFHAPRPILGAQPPSAMAKTSRAVHRKGPHLPQRPPRGSLRPRHPRAQKDALFALSGWHVVRRHGLFAALG